MFSAFEVGEILSVDLIFLLDRPEKEDQDALLGPTDLRRTCKRGSKPLGFSGETSRS